MEKEFIQISGVVPSLTARASIETTRTETGIGAVMPWANKLWFITYLAHTSTSGSGSGLFMVDENFNITKHPESVDGTYANRMVHPKSSQVIIGPHVIDTKGNVRTIHSLTKHRLTACMLHLEKPESMIYMLTMEGLLFEVDVYTLESRLLFDLVKELHCSEKCVPHFKGGWIKDGTIVVANNSYEESEFLGEKSDGRLAQWDGKEWHILEEKPFCEVTGGKNTALFATGWDKASAILKTFVKGKWTTYRLPKATQAMDNYILTEWPRIREVETERLLLDFHGMFYELTELAYEGKIWGLRPISTHLRMVPDFCSWRGMLVLAGNQVTPIWDTNMLAGEPQSNLWFGKTDDLWSFGKPAGWGGPWWEEDVKADVPSDPYLMTGFDKKVLHLSNNSNRPVQFKIEVDFLGNQTWKTYDTISVPVNGYVHHEFPTGFSAHWCRITPDADCNASAYFIYS